MKKIRNKVLNGLITISRQLFDRSEGGIEKLIYLFFLVLLFLWSLIWWWAFSKPEREVILTELNHLTKMRTRSFSILVIVLLMLTIPVSVPAAKALYKLLASNGKIHLQVLDDRGKPISNLDVNVIRQGHQQDGIGLVTDGNGSVIVKDLRSGEYNVRVFRVYSTNEIESMDGNIMVGDSISENKWIFTPKKVHYIKFANVNFETGKWDLSYHYNPILDDVAKHLEEPSRMTLLIHGHCDEDGSDEYNFELGAKRAQQMLKVLNSKGISSDQILLFSYGKGKPLGLDFFDKGANRRVELYLIMDE